MHDRLIQIAALAVLLVGAVACAALLPSIVDESERHALRYTDVSVEGAPPFVALGTAIGALRGIIVDYLWIKVNLMKEKGLYYEVMADADLITKLQPRFAAVWAFHGHNMAYNLSVATHTRLERWEWVKAGIRLVRSEGLKYNPNDLKLHQELAFWFSHKIEGLQDDAHLFYKTEFCREWHEILGEPPPGHDERVAWIGAVADAPRTIEEAEARTPGVAALVERLRQAMAPHQEGLRHEFALDSRFLRLYTFWQDVTQRSAAARLLEAGEKIRQERPAFRAFQAVAEDPDPGVQAAWPTLLAHVRALVLREEYNMDPQLMFEFTSELGPIDWRHASAHALYWARRGERYAENRLIHEEDTPVRLNTVRVQLQAMQDLARWGRILFDPFAGELPGRFPDNRWTDVIGREFERVYAKYYGTRGGGPDTFASFFENFMKSAVREAYRSGDRERARRLYDRLDELFGTGAGIGSGVYRVPLERFVQKEVYDQYQFQPHLAPSDVAASFRYGLLYGLGQGDLELFRQAVEFADQVTTYFKNDEYNFYNTKFGEGRMRDIIKGVGDSAAIALALLMVDPSLRMEDRITVWSQVDRVDPELRARVYDEVRAPFEKQFATHFLSRRYTLDQALPQPPNLEQVRAKMAQEIADWEKQRQQAPDMPVTSN
jgi:hypothetical protein